MVHLPYENVTQEEHLKSSAESTSSPIMEEVSLDDASHPKSESSQEIFSVTADVEEEAQNSKSSVHFTPLKVDDEEADVDAWLDEDEGNDVKETADRGLNIHLRLRWMDYLACLLISVVNTLINLTCECRGSSKYRRRCVLQ